MRRIGGGIAVLVGLLLVVPAAPALSAAPGELDGFEYVSLGDSYSAGFGLVPYSATSPFTATPSTDPNGCYQADANYPHLVASALGLALDDQTCSGAVAGNLGYPSGTTLPTPPTPTPSLLPALTAGSQVQLTMSGQTATQLQTAALSDSTDIVTFAIGGNDLGFADIAEACIRLTNTGDPTDYVTGLQFLAGIQVNNCSEVFDGTNPLYADFDLPTRISQFVLPRIEAVLDEIAAAAPNAQVFVVGYPQVATGDPTLAAACFTSPLPPATNAVPFSGTDILFIHDIETQLDAALQVAAADRGFHFLSSTASTAENALCTADPWINGLTAAYPTGGTCPANYEPLGHDGNVYVCVELGALHPNAAGVDNLASLVTPAVNAAFGTSLSVGSVAPGSSLTVSGAGFRPGEQVGVVLHSTPVSIGTFLAGPRGAFSGSVTVPATVAPGAHSIVSTGQTSGRAFSAPITVELAATGSDSAMPLLLALCFVTAGFLLITARRGRPSWPAR